jgi:hypothetical protein
MLGHRGPKNFPHGSAVGQAGALFHFLEWCMSIVLTQPESLTTKLILSRLSPHFHLVREVKGCHSITGSNKRIDFVLIPKSNLIEQKFPNLPVGLELKAFNLEDGNKKQVCLLSKQAVDYRYTRFKMRSGHHFLPLILIHPPIRHYLEHSNPDRTDFNDGFEWGLARTLGQWFVGELSFPENGDGFEIFISASRYYRMRNGVGKRLNLNWGFEKYEKVKQELIEKNLTHREYEDELLRHVDLLGI